MDKQKWINFKKYAIEHIWECENNGWISALYRSNLMAFFSKTKQCKKNFRKYFKLRFKIIRKPVIPVLEYVVTTRCSMNCKNCNTLVPYFTKETHINFVSFDTFKNDLDKLLKSVDYINLFGFVGGEPLLNKILAKMIEYACSKRKIKHVFVATNCTIIPDADLLKVLKHKKIGVQISNYSNVKNIKSGAIVQHYEVKKILQDNHVWISNPHEPSGSKNWQTMPKLYPDKQDLSKVIKYYNGCYGRFCYMYADGLILQCTACIYMSRNLELNEDIKKEIVNVRLFSSKKDLTNALINFLSKPYSEFCHYCHFVDMKYGLPCGEQIE